MAMARMTNVRRVALLSALAALAPGVARADDRANAETLFQLGKAAMARREFPAACKYFEDSLRLEDTIGTLINLASCHEEVGKVGSAWGEFRAVEDRALRAVPVQEDRARVAHARAEALFPRLSRVRIVVAEGSRVDGLEIKVDDVVAQPSLWEVGVVVDPGTRRVSAAAPSHQPWETHVRVDDEGRQTAVEIPRLARQVAKPPPPTGPVADPGLAEAVSANRARRTLGFVVGGAGLASIGLGATMGVLSITKTPATRCAAPCPERLPDGSPNPKLEAARSEYAVANTYANVANVAVGVGVATVVVGAVIVLTAPRVQTAGARTVRVGLGGVTLEQEF